MSITNNNAVAKVAAAVAGAGLVLSSFAFTVPVQADTTSDLQAQINALLAQIASLQSQLGGGSSMTGQFTRDLTIGSTGADVTQLQTWLISKGYSIPAGATGYFGSQTQAAVAAFQAANGITPAAGFFGPITRAKVNSMLGGGTVGGTTGGGTLSGGEATLSNYNLTSGDTVAEGDMGTEIASVKFDVRGGDINVGRVKVEVQGVAVATASQNPWLYFTKLYVYDGSTKVGSVDVSSRDAWDSNNTDTTMNTNGANDYTVDVPVSDIVKDGDTAMLSVKADAQSTIDTANTDQQFTLRIPTDGIRAVDAKGIQEYTGSDTDKVTVDFNGSTAGKLSVSEASDDPDAGVLVADANQATTNLSVFNFNLKNTEDSNSRVDSVKVTVATTTAVGSSAKNITSIIRKATLTIDGNDYDGTVTGSTNTILFDLNNEDVIVDANSTQEGKVTIDLASQVGHYATSGESLTFSIAAAADVVAEGANNGDSTTVTGSASGKKQSIALNGGISVSGKHTDNTVSVPSQNTITSTYGTFTVKFAVTAIGDTVYVPRAIDTSMAGGLLVNTSGHTSSTTYVGVGIDTEVSSSTASTTNSVVTTSLTSTAGTQNNGNALWYVINAGNTETFTAQATINPNGASGDINSFQVGLDVVKFSTDPSNLNNLQTLDIDETDAQFNTDPTVVPG